MTRLWHEPRAVAHVPGLVQVETRDGQTGFSSVIPPSTVELNDTKEMEALTARRFGAAPVAVASAAVAKATTESDPLAEHAKPANGDASVADVNSGFANLTRLSAPYRVWLSRLYVAHRIERYAAR